jgi:thioredoxin reductase (NADPH)
MKEYDAVVVGGGPAGITACLYILRAGASLAWVEKMAPGGQVLLTDWVDNYPGFPDGIKGFELIDRMSKHLEGFSYDKYMEDVTAIEPGDSMHEVRFGEQGLRARTVVICSGAEHKKVGIPGEEELSGRGVSYCGVCDGQFFRDQEVACVGGGNTALQESLYLSGLARKVFLVHRRSQFRGDKIYQDKVFKTSNIETVLGWTPKRILGQDAVRGLEVEKTATGESKELNVDGVFVFVGIKPQSEFVPPAVEKDPFGFVVTDAEMRTNVPGIFAAGDVRSKRCWQISTAVGDGATAGHNVHLYLEEN